jgi:hypothetical protein
VRSVEAGKEEGVWGDRLEVAIKSIKETCPHLFQAQWSVGPHLS